MRVVTVIPARYASQRLPGKPLSEIQGKPMIQWVVERASAAPSVHRTVVATDDERVFSAVREFGGEGIMTSKEARTGTDRVAEAMGFLNAADEDVCINVQGDEPLIEPADIEAALELVSSGRFKMATLSAPISNEADLLNPSVVKVLRDGDGRASKFSRTSLGPESRHHVGLYVYTVGTLREFAKLPQTESEKNEKLEQLRALDHGIQIGVADCAIAPIGVDTPEDLAAVREQMREV